MLVSLRKVFAFEGPLRASDPASEHTERQEPPPGVAIGLLGYFGAGSIGDDLMLRSILHLLAERPVKLVVFARDPRFVTTDGLPNIEVRRAEPRSFLKALRSLDVVVRCGGTVFHDEAGQPARHMMTGYLKQLAVIVCCRLTRTPFVMVGVGLGAVRRRSTTLVLRTALGLSDLVIVRDAPSLARARRHSRRPTLRLGVDLVLMRQASEPAVKDARRTLAASLVDLERYGLATSSPGQVDRWVALVAELVEREGLAHVKLIVFKDNERESDRPITEAVAHGLAVGGISCSIQAARSSSEAVAAIESASAVLATRYHAAVLAARSGKPTLIVPYNEKLHSFATDLGVARSVVPIKAFWASSELCIPKLRVPKVECLDDRRRSIIEALAAVGGG